MKKSEQKLYTLKLTDGEMFIMTYALGKFMTELENTKDEAPDKKRRDAVLRGIYKLTGKFEKTQKNFLVENAETETVDMAKVEKLIDGFSAETADDETEE